MTDDQIFKLWSRARSIFALVYETRVRRGEEAAAIVCAAVMSEVDHRAVAIAAISGIASGSLVLADRGWVAIEDKTIDDLLEVAKTLGITAPPDSDEAT